MIKSPATLNCHSAGAAHNVMSRSCSVTRRNKFVCDESLSNSTENYDYQVQRATAFVHKPAAKLQRCDFPFPIVSRLN